MANESCIMLLIVTFFALTDITVNNFSRSFVGNVVTYLVYGIIIGNLIGIGFRVVTGL